MKNTAIALGFTFGASSILLGIFHPDKEASLPFPDAVEVCGPKEAVTKPKKKVNFLSQNVEKKEVNLTVIGTYNADNHGMNFNGYSKGKATYKIPTGWKVNVTFENWSPVPHSVVVVEERVTRKPQMGQPYFDGAIWQRHPKRPNSALKWMSPEILPLPVVSPLMQPVVTG